MVILDLVTWAIGLLITCLLARELLVFAWWNPRETEKQFRKQGIDGPSYKFLVGSFGELAKIYRSKSKLDGLATGTQIKHTIIPNLFPHLHLWRQKYGHVFLYWFGPSARLVVTEPVLIKEMLNNTNLFIKSIPHPAISDMMGEGLLFAEGDKWARHRRIFSPFFFTEALKGHVQSIVSSSSDMMARWEHLIISHEQEIEIHSQFRRWTKDVTARTAFQSNFKQVDDIAELQLQQMAMLKQVLRSFYIPGSRFLPTPYNIKRWKVHRELHEQFKGLVKNRDEATQNDLLGMMLSATNNDIDQGRKMSPQELMDECRTFFLAGFASTSDFITWVFVMLATHTDWQDRARQEVTEVLQGKPPGYDILGRLKIVNMILNETLRLYPPVPFILKKVENEVKLGNLTIPAGTNIEIPLVAVHHDPQQWGDDVHEFNPARFAQGAAKASKHPMAFMPFTSGPRVCIGQNLALMEAKICLSMILQNFSFVISPSYKHSPECLVTTTPRHGAHLVFRKI